MHAINIHRCVKVYVDVYVLEGEREKSEPRDSVSVFGFAEKPNEKFLPTLAYR